jgi:hypothetical protein
MTSRDSFCQSAQRRINMQTDQKNTFAQDDTSDVAKAARRELEDAKVRLSGAADRVKHEAQNAGSTISTLVLDELDRRAADMGTQIRSVASRLRGERSTDDNLGASEMAEHAADLIDDVSSRLQGQSIREMGQRLGQFGRENPALFVMGCLLTGAMAGRMIVASDTSSSGSEKSRWQDRGQDRSRPADQAYGGQASAGNNFATANARQGKGGNTEATGYAKGKDAHSNAGVVGGAGPTVAGSNAKSASQLESGRHD